MSDVEFLAEDGPAGGSDPTGPVRRGRPGWWGLAALGCAAVAVGYVLTRPSAPAQPQAAGPTQRPVPTTSRSANPCAGSLYCKISLAVPAPLRAAVQHYLPTADEVQVRTQYGAGPIRAFLAARDIEIHTPTSTVFISLHPLAASPDAKPSAIIDAPLGFGSAVVHSRLDGFDVDAQYVAPETVPPALDALRRLTGDPRLVNG